MKKILFLSCCLLLLAAGGACSKAERNVFATLHGTVSDSENGDPIANATVSLSPGGKNSTTGTEGYFEFADLDAVQYTITVQKTGYQTNRKTITAVSGENTEVNIPLTKN
jgi:hypothetical protein